MNIIETHKCHGGKLTIYEHDSTALNCAMRFSVFEPPFVTGDKAPVLTFLSGLTCTHDNFTTKSGAYAAAAKAGIAIIAPDTSPRGEHVPDDTGSYDFGKGAGFYINATQTPWVENYQMESYIAGELHALIHENLAFAPDKHGITGHSMGGHGALTLYLKYPDKYKSASAFSPIVAPTQVPWGQKAFAGYLGADEAEWQKHDATALMKNTSDSSEGADSAESADRSGFPPILIDQGLDDNFLTDQLKPQIFADACKHSNQALNLRMHEGYDHSYYFIQSFIADHIDHHSKILAA